MRLPLTAGRSAATGDLAVGQGTTDGGKPASPAGEAAGQPARSGRPGRSWPGAGRMAAAALRRHWLISLLLLAGLVLRVLAMIAYRPALLYIDSLKYIFGAWPGNDPLGYNVILKIVLVPGNLTVVTALQHLAGLAMAVTLYAVLLRRGVPRWLAALAAAPVLLDGYEIQIEQTIMPNVWFEACIVAGLALLLWRPRPGPRLIVAGGLVLGLSAPMAQVGQILIVPALAFVLIVAPRLAPQAHPGWAAVRRVPAAHRGVLGPAGRGQRAFLAGPRVRQHDLRAAGRARPTAQRCTCPATSGRSARPRRWPAGSARTGWCTAQTHPTTCTWHPPATRTRKSSPISTTGC